VEGNHVIATLFDSNFQPKHTLAIDGSPSRARVAPDGRYAAFTVFVTGHSYNDANLSVATIILDTNTGASLGNLEEFETLKDGQHFEAIEFNFWGVTFAQDSNLFYATLRYKDTTYLVQGDIMARTLTVLRENVECPSLSPDGTHIAFKKRTPDGKWRLTVLDLATMQEIPLAEEQSIDDQVEWLDNKHILYENIDPNPPPWMSIFMVPADGSGAPVVYVSNAVSPVFVP
jgi:Tol biopolymer transport system component